MQQQASRSHPAFYAQSLNLAKSQPAAAGQTGIWQGQAIRASADCRVQQTRTDIRPA